MQHLPQHHQPHSLNLNLAARADPSCCRAALPTPPSTEAHLLLSPPPHEGLLFNTHSFLPTETSDALPKLPTHTSPPSEIHFHTHRALPSPEHKLSSLQSPIADDGRVNTPGLSAREGQLNTQISLAFDSEFPAAHIPAAHMLPLFEGKLRIPLPVEGTKRLQTSENELARKTEGRLGMQEYHSNSSSTSSENYRPNIPSGPINTQVSNAQEDSKIESRILVDHLSSIDKVTQRKSNDSSAEMTTASTELCMMGWRRYCSPPAAVNVPARVSALHRQIVMISDPKDREDSIYNALSDHGVCLELNIGPSKGGGAHTGSKKTLQDIHSEERSGFSKWQRPVPSAGSTPKCKGNAGRMCWSEGLDVRPCVCAPASPLRFCLGLNNPNTIPVSTTISSDCIDPAITTHVKIKNHDTFTSDCSHTCGSFNPSPLTSRFLGVCSTEYAPQAAVCANNDRILPTSVLLQAAFPSEISCKIRKLDIEAHSNLTPSKHSESDVNQDGFQCQIAHNSMKTSKDDYMEEVKHLEIKKADKEQKDSAKLLAMIDLERMRYHGLNAPRILRPLDMPNVQERSLVEFLHAKKQHRDHFLDKVVVKEDVYQSHPWNFMGGGHGEGGTAVGSLYFCCSTKYTKRGNMTRNRMTREGGRWKQQGMVQPIYYSSTTSSSHGGGGGSSEAEAAHKTYLSYIPRGSCSKGRASFFINLHNSSTCLSDSAVPSRLKHRHRMIEIALQEDLLVEKRSFQLKVTPKPFLVVCVLRNSSN